MLKNCLLLVALLGASISAQQVSLDPKNVCPLMVDGTKIMDQTLCDTYYVCNDGIPTTMECASGLQYNKDTQTCVTASQGTCATRANLTTLCQGLPSGTYVADSTNSAGYYYCDGSSAPEGHGDCPNGQIFQASTQSCVYGTAQITASTNNDICSIVPNLVFFGNETDCAAWGACKAGQYVSGVCDTGTLFDTANGVCTVSSSVSCEQTSMFTGTTVSNAVTVAPQGGACTTANTFISDNATCNGYYWCGSDLQYYHGICSNNYFFDNTTGTCVQRSNVLCTVGDVCVSTVGTTYTWVNSPTDCHSYYYCSNNKQAATAGVCPNGEYFNEVNQDCETAKPTYAACYGSGSNSTDSSTTVASDSSATTAAGADSTATTTAANADSTATTTADDADSATTTTVADADSATTTTAADPDSATTTTTA